VDRLKVDRSFIRDIATDPNRGAFARAIIGLAHGMNIPVVAEGVESSEARDMLQLEGCDEGQGYYYSQPVPIEALALVVETLELSTQSAAKQRVSLAVLAADGDLSLTEIIDRLA
jgi:EAL domain-containing protein (putative c-di-GMP-specific phosphodiesterase class I)